MSNETIHLNSFRHNLSSILIDYIVSGGAGETAEMPSIPIAGVDKKLINTLTALDHRSMMRLKSSIFGKGLKCHIEVDSNVLQSLITMSQGSLQRSNLYNQAILFGASKMDMRYLVNMGSEEFCERRKELGIDGRGRARPKILSQTEFKNLINESLLISGEVLQKEAATIDDLVVLSKNTGVDINRIYRYFWQ